MCMEGALGYYKNLEEAVYKKHIERKKIEDFNPPNPAEGVHKMARYAYAITYVEDDRARGFWCEQGFLEHPRS